MKNKKIILLGLGLLLVVTTLVVSIAAWLTDIDETPYTTFTIGQVKYEIVSDFIEGGTIVPGQQLIANSNEEPVAIRLTNSSTVNSKVRVHIKVYFGGTLITNQSGLDAIFTTGGLNEGFSLDSGWVRDGDSTTWYYGAAAPGVGVESVDLGAIIDPTTTSIPVLSSLKLDGSKVGNDDATKSLTIKFIFEAKQADYVSWSEFASAFIDFESGLPSED